jgi:hypothetical protein
MKELSWLIDSWNDDLITPMLLNFVWQIWKNIF